MSAENPSSPTPERPRPPSQSRRQETDPSRATPAASPRRLRASTATPRAPNMPQPGDLIDERYLIESVIGKGGMGCVLSARHMLLQTQVAIKLLKAQTPLASEMLERFLREGRAIAALRGEHVVRVMDMGMTGDGVPYLVMEFLPGQNLAQVIRERAPLPVDEAARYMLQVCEALLEAHGQGTFHRDIKPANIFVTGRPDGSPLIKVLDFGIAKVLAPGETCSGTVEGITQEGQVLGTQYYMPPEQIRCARTADGRSDIWSLGVVLYELLTKKRPFSGTGAGGIMASVVADQPPPPSSLRPDLPPPLNALIMQCLEKAPERRPQGVADVIEVLRPFASGTTLAGSPGGALLALEAEPPTEPLRPPSSTPTPSTPTTSRTIGPLAGSAPMQTDPAVPLVVAAPEPPASPTFAPVVAPTPEVRHTPSPARGWAGRAPRRRLTSRSTWIVLGCALVLILLGIGGVWQLASRPLAAREPELAAREPELAAAAAASPEPAPAPTVAQTVFPPAPSVERAPIRSATSSTSATSEPAPASPARRGPAAPTTPRPRPPSPTSPPMKPVAAPPPSDTAASPPAVKQPEKSALPSEQY